MRFEWNGPHWGWYNYVPYSIDGAVLQIDVLGDTVPEGERETHTEREREIQADRQRQTEGQRQTERQRRQLITL